MGVLSNFEPKEPLRFFEDLCGIPHGSKNTKAISDYCVTFAKERGLEVIQDEWNNVIIIKEATKGYEKKDTLILQGHLDMVCVKTPDSDFDFMNDGLNIQVMDGWIEAKDTSLGGDDGIAIAMALAVLDSNELSHPRIEVIFTVDEEIGLIGAQHIDLSMLKGKKLINIDSEDDTEILTSCAGGLSLECTFPMSFLEKDGLIYQIEINGLLGGHSGAEIHKQRGNAAVLIGRVLHSLGDLIEVSDIAGGVAHNVIPRMASAQIVVDACDETLMLDAVKAVELTLKDELSLTDGEVYIEVKCMGSGVKEVLDSKSKLLALSALMNIPNGIQAMSSSIPGLVETSINLGKCSFYNKDWQLEYSIRSSKETAKRYLGDRIIALVKSLGGMSKELGGYPGWEYKVDSQLRETLVKIYTNVMGKAPIISAIHAGLECGLFSEKIENLDCVSIGPNMEAIHSVDERLEIVSVERIWKLLVEVLAD